MFAVLNKNTDVSYSRVNVSCKNVKEKKTIKTPKEPGLKKTYPQFHLF